MNQVVTCLPCDHPFHTECIKKWITAHRRTCPVCNAQVFADIDIEEFQNDTESGSRLLLQQQQTAAKNACAKKPPKVKTNTKVEENPQAVLASISLGISGTCINSSSSPKPSCDFQKTEKKSGKRIVSKYVNGNHSGTLITSPVDDDDATQKLMLDPEDFMSSFSYASKKTNGGVVNKEKQALSEKRKGSIIRGRRSKSAPRTRAMQPGIFPLDQNFSPSSNLPPIALTNSEKKHQTFMMKRSNSGKALHRLKPLLSSPSL